MKNLIVTLTLFLCSFGGFAQKLIRSVAYTPYIDMYTYTQKANSAVDFRDLDETSSMRSFCIIAVDYGLRYSISDINESSSLSIAAYPRVGLSFVQYTDKSNDADNYGSLTLPVFIEYNHGIGSNFTNIDDTGFGLGAGVLLRKEGLIGAGSSYKYGLGVIPAAKANYKIFKGDSRAAAVMEYGIQLGYGSTKLTEIRTQNSAWVNTFHFNFSMRFYLNL